MQRVIPRLSVLPLLTNMLPGTSASEVTTLWRCANLFIIIIMVYMLLQKLHICITEGRVYQLASVTIIEGIGGDVSGSQYCLLLHVRSD